MGKKYGRNFCRFSQSAGRGLFSASRHLIKNRHRQIVVTSDFPVLALCLGSKNGTFLEFLLIRKVHQKN